MFCRKCGTECKDEAKFCPHCGEPLMAVPSADNKADPPEEQENASGENKSGKPPEKKRTAIVILVIAVVVVVVALMAFLPLDVPRRKDLKKWQLHLLSKPKKRLKKK